jgi:nucleoside-diphosphate-sugar epimerase
MNTLLIAGFGDIARRAAPQLLAHFRVLALVRPERLADVAVMPGLEVEPADLDAPKTLEKLAGRCTHLLHCAPPPAFGTRDPRTANLLAALTPPAGLQRVVYISTSGVYGDCAGAWVDERREAAPGTDRARRRVDAETILRCWGARNRLRIVILRAPGIYAPDRLPLQRLRNRTPVLRPEDDVYTNHIHADDLAAIAVRALTHPTAAGIYNASDDSVLRMGEWFDLIADRTGLPRPARIPRTEAAAHIPAPLISFMTESRRLCNARMKQELGVRLRYPTVHVGLPQSIEP